MNNLIQRAMRLLVSKGINAGVKASLRHPQGKARPQDKAAAKRARQTVRAMRRLTRF